jgi:hypothetical protein
MEGRNRMSRQCRTSMLHLCRLLLKDVVLL